MGFFDFLKKPPAPEAVKWDTLNVPPRPDALVPAVGVTVIDFYSMNDMKLGLNPVRQAMISTAEWIVTDANGAPVLGVNAGAYENIDQATMQKSLRCTDAHGKHVGAWEHYAVGDRIVIYGYSPAFKDQKPSKGTKCDKPVYALARGHIRRGAADRRRGDAQGPQAFVRPDHLRRGRQHRRISPAPRRPQAPFDRRRRRRRRHPHALVDVPKRQLAQPAVRSFV
ncbi:hypothetical protein M885DRAFT_534021 [Pelagophyceae sp. CCMP2097]|nr:hypothetical protein M885DRAFT_534021 [Pelagophyceae sp. CCMP2097]